jgi:pimeloyl-ACP methyl ester carboxylesterase
VDNPACLKVAIEFAMHRNRCLLVSVFALLSWTVHHEGLRAEELRDGYHKEVRVGAETSIDSIYPLANQSPKETPAGWLAGYDSTQQRYELFIPAGYDEKKTWPVVLFVSPGNQPTGYAAFRKACTKLGFIFASPYEAGNNCPSPRRTRIVVDVLDDVRRRFNTDVERTYIGGFSGGGRVACNIAFALPEYFGGVIPVCAAGELRQESYLRRRCMDRLSVALITGERDFNRGEVERFRGPMLKEVGVRARIWVKSGMGHAVPDGGTLADVLEWLDQSAADRRQLAKRSPTTSAPPKRGLERADQARQLLDAAEKLLGNAATTYDGLMLMKGISIRWADLPESRRATQTLLKYDADDAGRWRDDDIAEQRRFLIARAHGLDSYASGPLAKQYEPQRANMARAALELWKQVISDGRAPKAITEANKRLSALTKILDSAK